MGVRVLLTSSCKSKGRRLQQLVRDRLREIGKFFGLRDADIESVPTSVPGLDIILSPLAKDLLNLYIECKNVESLNVVGVFQKHYEKYKSDAGVPILVHSRNRTEPMVTLTLDQFLEIFHHHLAHVANFQAQVPNREHTVRMIERNTIVSF
jgi:hypothetical protein